MEEKCRESDEIPQLIIGNKRIDPTDQSAIKNEKNLFQAGIPHAGLDQPPRLFHGQHENKRIVRKDLGNEAEFHLIPWADSLSCELHYLMAVQLSYMYICNISNYIKKDLKNVSHSHSTANYLGFGSYNMSSLKRQHKF